MMSGQEFITMGTVASPIQLWYSFPSLQTREWSGFVLLQTFEKYSVPSLHSTPCYPNHHLAQPKSQQHHLQHTSTHVVLYNLHASVFDYLPITAVDFIEARIFFLTGIRAYASKARIVACISFKHFKNRRPHHLITLISTFWTSETFSEREGMLTGPTVSTWRQSMTHLCFWPTLTLDVAVLCNQVLNFCIRYQNFRIWSQMFKDNKNAKINLLGAFMPW